MQQSVRLAGGTEYVTHGQVSAVRFERTDPFSVSFWCRVRTKLNGYRALVSSMSTSQNIGWKSYITSSGGPGEGYVEFILGNGASGEFRVINAPKRVDDQLWHHVVLTSDGVNAAGLTIYIDNVPYSVVTSDTLTSASIVDGTAELRWAVIADGTAPFMGNMCQVAVWDKELSASEVEETWQGGRVVDLTSHSAAANLVIYVPADGDTYPVLVDTEAVASGTMTNMESRDLYTEGPPVSSVSAKFDGSDDYGAIASSSAYNYERTTPFSVSGWVKVKAEGAYTVLGKQGGTPFTGWMLFMVEGKPTFNLVSNIGGGDYLSVEGDNPYNDGEWHHIIATSDGSSTAAGIAIYVDGLAVATTILQDTLSSSILSSAVLTVGARLEPGVTNLLTGLVSELAVYDKELSSGEATTIYGNGDPPHLRGAAMPGNLQGYWKMGDWDIYSLLRDMSGNGNDLTTAGMGADSLLYMSPPAVRLGVAAASLRYTDYSSDKVTAADTVLSFDNADLYTIAVWVNNDSGNFSNDTIFTKALYGGGYAQQGYTLYINQNPTTRNLVFQIVGSGNSTADAIRITWVGAQKRYGWTQVVVTYDGSVSASGVKMYLDGEQVPVTINFDTLTTTSASGSNLRIGGSNTTNDSYAGLICDIRFYKDIVAGPEEVRELFNARSVVDPTLGALSGWLVSWFRLGDTDTVPNFLDYSPYKNDGVSTGIVQADIKVGEVPAPLTKPTFPIFFDGNINAGIVYSYRAGLDFERTAPFAVAFTYKNPSPKVGKVVGDISTTGWEVAVVLDNPTGDVSFRLLSVASSNELQIRTDIGGLCDGTEHHVYVSYDGSSTPGGVEFYVDGVLVGTTLTVFNTLSSSIVSGSGNVQIGHPAGSSIGDPERLLGFLSDVLVYDKVLNQAERALVYNSGNGGDYAAVGPTGSLAAWWRLDLSDRNLSTLVDYAVRFSAWGTMKHTVPFGGEFFEELIMPAGGTEAGGSVTNYRMRAAADPGPGYVHWSVQGAPDSAGVQAPSAIQAGTAVVVGEWGAENVLL